MKMDGNTLLISCLLVVSVCMGKIAIESTQPHNKNCYTQGLFFLNNTHIFQTCGLYKQSYFHVMQYQAAPFELRQAYTTSIPWKANIFLEGAILFNSYIYLLTWREKIVYQLNSTTLQLVRQITWNKDGWGLTTNGTHMFTTDGSNIVYVVDHNFNLLQTIPITTQTGAPQYNINELQFVGGYIYANIYLQTTIVKIDIQSGKVVEEYDGTPLAQSESGLQDGEVLNGIAYDKGSGKFLLTGKHWSKVYQVSLTQDDTIRGIYCRGLIVLLMILLY